MSNIAQADIDLMRAKATIAIDRLLTEIALPGEVANAVRGFMRLSYHAGWHDAMEEMGKTLDEMLGGKGHEFRRRD